MNLLFHSFIFFLSLVPLHHITLSDVLVEGCFFNQCFGEELYNEVEQGKERGKQTKEEKEMSLISFTYPSVRLPPSAPVSGELDGLSKSLLAVFHNILAGDF